MKQTMTAILTMTALIAAAGTLPAKPPPQLPPLIAAAAVGDPGTVRRLLKQGADVGVRCSVLHNHTALEAAIWHRQNDIERFAAGPPDIAGHALENQPLHVEDRAKDEDFRKIVGMLRQAIKDNVKKRKHSR